MRSQVASAALVVLCGCASSGPDSRPGEATVAAAESPTNSETPPTSALTAPGSHQVEVTKVPALGDNAPQDTGPVSPVYRVEALGPTVQVSTQEGLSATFSLKALTRASARGWNAMPQSWQRSDRGFSTTIDGPGWRWNVLLETDRTRSRLGLHVDVEYLVDIEIDHEEVLLVFESSNGHQVLGRDLVERAVRVGNQYLTDSWTPLEVSTQTPLGPITVIRNKGFPSAVTEGTETTLSLHLELDDRGNHPYQPYIKCNKRYASRLPQHDIWSTVRRRGERVSHRADIWFGNATPLRVERLPEGRRAAVVFTSHADQSKAANTSALLWGHSNPSHPSYGRRGMIGHGLSLTLTAWAARGRFTDMNEPQFLDILRRAREAGVEVSPHSTTPYEEDREMVSELMKRYTEFHPATWIDHQPETNCEALNNGAGITDGDSRFAVVDVLRRSGIRYFWSIPDVNPPGGMNILGSSRPSYRPTLMFRNPRLEVEGEQIWMFKSCWRFVKSQLFLRWNNQQKLRRLVKERGIHIAHVYMDYYEPSGRLADRSLLEPSGMGLRLRDDADQVFQHLGRLNESKQIWVASMRDLGDHLDALSKLDLEYLPDGSARISARGRGIKALSVTAPLTDTTVEIDGGPPDGARWEREETTFWMDVDTGKSRTIGFEAMGARRRLMPKGSTVPYSSNQE